MTTPTSPESPKRKNDEATNRLRCLLPIAIVLIAASAIGLLWASRSQPANDFPEARLTYRLVTGLTSPTVLNLQTGERIKLTYTSYHPQKLSPNKTWSALWRDLDQCCEVVLKVLAPGRSMSFGPFEYSSGSISWMPDNQWVVFSAKPQTAAANSQEAARVFTDEEIYMGNITTLELKPLTDNDFTDRYPDVSPDGTQIVYTSDADGVDRLYLMDLATRESRLLTPDQDGYRPAWSPDGRWIAFTSNCYSSIPGYVCTAGDLWIIRADGTGAQSILVGEGAAEAVWLP